MVLHEFELYMHYNFEIYFKNFEKYFSICAQIAHFSHLVHQIVRVFRAVVSCVVWKWPWLHIFDGNSPQKPMPNALYALELGNIFKKLWEFFFESMHKLPPTKQHPTSVAHPIHLLNLSVEKTQGKASSYHKNSTIWARIARCLANIHCIPTEKKLVVGREQNMLDRNLAAWLDFIWNPLWFSE